MIDEILHLMLKSKNIFMGLFIREIYVLVCVLCFVFTLVWSGLGPAWKGHMILFIYLFITLPFLLGTFMWQWAVSRGQDGGSESMGTRSLVCDSISWPGRSCSSRYFFGRWVARHLHSAPGSTKVAHWRDLLWHDHQEPLSFTRPCLKWTHCGK